MIEVSFRALGERRRARNRDGRSGMKPLRALLVDDSESDTLLVVRELERGGYRLSWERVEDAADMREALGRSTWDVVISDWSMPTFSALAALGGKEL